MAIMVIVLIMFEKRQFKQNIHFQRIRACVCMGPDKNTTKKQKSELFTNLRLEYCFVREKEIVFAQQKQSVPMSINEFVEMTIFLCLTNFSVYDKMQSFIDESGLLFHLMFFFFFFFFAFYAEIQDGCQKWWENDF